MRYRRFGTTGVEVSTQCLGTMNFGRLGNVDADESARVIRRALDGGINVIDTADVYSGGQAEEIVGQAVGSRRDDVVLATKCFFPMGGQLQRGSSRRWITQAVEGSLRRLGTDRIDLYQIHKLDWNTDVEETLGALTDLVRQGKVLYLGSSSFPADWIVEAQWAAARRPGETANGSSVSNRSTRSSRGRWNRRCYRPASDTGWRSSPGAPSPADG